MKLNKIFAIALAAITMTACSDDDDVKYNTASGVTVSMQQTTLEFPEDRVSSNSYCNIPIVVTGEANGTVEVTVEIKEDATSPAQAGKDYILTSKVVKIPAGKSVGYLEFYQVGNKEENTDRVFTVTIVSAKGATIGAEASTNVYLLDNEHLLVDAYRALPGMWNWSANGGSDTYDVVIQIAEEGTEAYKDKSFAIIGYQGIEDCVLEGTLSYNAATKQALMEIPLMQFICTDTWNIGTFDVYLGTIEDNYWITSGNFVGESNAELTKFSFGDQMFAGGLYQGTTFAGYVWFGDVDNTLTKLQ